MRKVRDVLTCLFDNDMSIRETAHFIGVNRSTVSDYQKRFADSPLTWPLKADIDDEMLEQALYSSAPAIDSAPKHNIDFAVIHAEMRKKGATLSVLHEECNDGEDGQRIGYSQFCRLYKKFKKSLGISLRNNHINGDATFVDYAGQTARVTDIETGEERTAQIFIGVLGGSNYTYCEATWSQKSRDWVESHIRMFEFFCGVSRVVVHDNLKSAVTKANRYEPIINESYNRLCSHYGTRPFAARVYKPKDKAKAEAGVQLVERWILFRLRYRKFFSLGELNAAIRELLHQLNQKTFQKLPGSRFSNWLASERASLQPVRMDRYEFAEWGVVRAGIDYHVIVDDHAYSVPHHLRGSEFDYRLTTRTLDLFQRGRNLTSHIRSYEKGKSSTHSAHRTEAHNVVAEWAPETFINWASEIGPGTTALVTMQLEKLNNNLFGYRLMQAMKKLQKTYGKTRMEQVSIYAVTNKVTNTDGLRKIFACKLDHLFETTDNRPAGDEQKNAASPTHENIRGPEYYSQILTIDESEEHDD